MRPLHLLLLLGLLTSSAQAAEPVTVVLHGAGADDRAVRDAWLRQGYTDTATRFTSTDELFPEGPVVLLGDSEVATCEGEPTTPADLDAFNDSIVDSLAEMEYLTASTRLEGAEPLIACLSEPPDPQALGLYHFLRGVVAFHAEGPGVATDRFEEALLASPFLQWDARYPPTVRPAFDAAVSSAMAGEKAFVGVSGRIVEEGTLWIDGVGVDRRTRTTTVYEGTHLLQWRSPEGVTRSWLVFSEGGETLALAHRTDAEQALLTGRADPLLTGWAWDRVFAPVEEQVGRLFAAQDVEGVYAFHHLDALGGRWILADAGRLARYRSRGRNLRSVGIGVSIGGLVLTGLGIGVSVDTLVRANHFEEAIQSGFAIDPSADDADEAYNDVRSNVGTLLTERSDLRSNLTAGWTLGIVGGVFTLGGIPLQVIGDQKARGVGFGRNRK